MQTTSQSSVLSRAVWWGTLLALVVAPTQYSFELLEKTYLSVVDPVIWVVFGLWLLDMALTRSWGRLRALPWAALLFVVLAALSSVRAVSRMAAAKDVFQYIEYLGVAWLLFAHVVSDPRGRDRLVQVFAGLVTVIVLLGAVQYVVPGTDDVAVRATFGNRNVFGGFLSLGLPFLFGLCLCDAKTWRRAWYGAVVAVGIGVTLAGGTFIALCAALPVVAALRSRRALLVTAAVLVAAYAFVLPALPRANRDVLHASVDLYNDEGEVTARYPEWQAASVMIQEYPLLGVGAGNYQRNIGMYYGIVPSPPAKAPPDSQNLYLVLASSLGLPGATCFVVLLVGAAVAALRSLAGNGQGVALGAFGAVLAFSINAVWSPLLVRGIGIPLTLVLVLASAGGAGGEKRTTRSQ